MIKYHLKPEELNIEGGVLVVVINYVSLILNHCFQKIITKILKRQNIFIFMGFIWEIIHPYQKMILKIFVK